MNLHAIMTMSVQNGIRVTFLLKNVDDTVVLLALKGFNSHHFYMFPCSRIAQIASVGKPQFKTIIFALKLRLQSVKSDII